MPDLTVVAPEGELDLARVGDFRDALADAAQHPTERLVVDLTAVSFIDSSGLSAIVDLYNRMRRARRELAVVVPAGTAPAVVISLSGLQTRLPIFETREAVLASAQSS